MRRLRQRVRLTLRRVRLIRMLHELGYRGALLARWIGCHQTTVHKIVRRKIHRGVA